ncbi:uncharacterized protein LOC142338115 [Convolutriloba macropyga]|uniref:uncharacterized protein LOC142338115 n=1 Tax=Convolutriloba macropyga TaxID=536237 RepID=UPI003F51E68F
MARFMKVIEVLILLLVGIPSSIAFFSNIMIIYGLRKRAKKNQKMKSGNANGNNGNNQSGSGGGSDFSMTTLLIVSSLLFLACESGVMWGNYVLFYSEPDADTPAEVNRQFRSTATSISEFCGAVNSSMNFFIYILCSRRFNAAFKEWFKVTFKVGGGGGNRGNTSGAPNTNTTQRG